MTEAPRTKVAVNGYGVIGKRVADAVALQFDMTLVGIADVTTDWRTEVAAQKGYTVYSATTEAAAAMRAAAIPVGGALEELFAAADVIVDCTPKHIGSQNAAKYRAAGIKFIVQGGEKHELTGHSFVAESSYAGAIGRLSTRVVSCNTTSVVRTLTALKSAGLLESARGTLLRRATDPWESHESGIMNTLVPEAKIPSHQGPDAQSVDPDLDVITMAVKVPQTLAHLHYWNVRLMQAATRAEVINAFKRSERIALIRSDKGLPAINSVKEWMLDIGRPHGDLYEVALWEDMITVQGDELFYAYMVDNQAIVVPETIDAIRALCGTEVDAAASIAKTNAALGIGRLTASSARDLAGE